MTDYTDLIARLRIVPLHSGFGSTCHAAADALEAQARRIEKLENDATYHESNDEVMMRDIEYYRARIAELEAALKPFADAYWQDDVSDYVPIGGKLTVDDFRAACVTMEGIDD